MPERDLAEHVGAMSDDELEATRRELTTSLGLMCPGNGMFASAQSLLSAVSTEVAGRAIREAS